MTDERQDNRRLVWESLSRDALRVLLPSVSEVLSSRALNNETDHIFAGMSDGARQGTSWVEVRRTLKEAVIADLTSTAGLIADGMIAQHQLRFDTYREPAPEKTEEETDA